MTAFMDIPRKNGKVLLKEKIVCRCGKEFFTTTHNRLCDKCGKKK